MSVNIGIWLLTNSQTLQNTKREFQWLTDEIMRFPIKSDDYLSRISSNPKLSC